MSIVEDISAWQGEIIHAVPIGKRMKRTMYNPNTGQQYYFKEPEKKFPWEFWTEVVAYKIGKQLGFNTLEYKPVIYNDGAGCLSPSMVNNSQDLIHGQQYLIQMMPQFDKKKGSDHSFQIVEQLFVENEDLEPLLKDFILMLVFDAIIGNHDRHQQNWAIIRTLNITFKNNGSKKDEPSFLKVIRKVMRWLDKKANTHGPVFEKIADIENILEILSFSPIFDNGNSLAYNILEEKIPDFLNQKDRFDRYLFGSKAHSHMRWNNDEVSYIDLLKNIQHTYPNEIKTGMDLVVENFNELYLEKMISEVDENFPASHAKYELTLARKELMYEIVVKRVEELLNRLS